MKKISVCICCYNEEENVELMYNAITQEMKKLDNYDYEIIFADNNSSDSTPDILRSLAQNDTRLKVILNKVNFGVDRSSVNCLLSATGDAIISITCDFQDPPSMIPEFIAGWEEGYDVVWGQKTKSKENPIKYMCRKLYYYIIDRFSDYKQIPQVIGFGIVDKSVMEIMKKTILQDPHVHPRHLVAEYGFNIKLIPYEQDKRLRGKSSYSISRYYEFAITSLCNTSIKPLRLMTFIGIFVGIFSVLVALFYLVYKLTHWYSFDAGMAPLVTGLFFVSGIQLFCMGILGEYVAVILRKVTSKTVVVEKERLNFDE